MDKIGILNKEREALILKLGICINETRHILEDFKRVSQKKELNETKKNQIDKRLRIVEKELYQWEKDDEIVKIRIKLNFKILKI